MAMIKDLPAAEKPREKGLQFGMRALSTPELLAILIRTGTKGRSAVDTAGDLLKKAGSVAGVSAMSVPELTRISGIGKVKALEIVAAMELSRRVALERVSQGSILDTPEWLFHWLQKEIGSSMQENFLVVYLDAGLHLISYRVLFTGSLNDARVYPREVFKEALLANSSAFMMVHNHPSGSLVPSGADLSLTKLMCETGRMMGVAVIDHIIVTANGYYSFAAEGLLKDAMDETCA